MPSTETSVPGQSSWAPGTPGAPAFRLGGQLASSAWLLPAPPCPPSLLHCRWLFVFSFSDLHSQAECSKARVNQKPSRLRLPDTARSQCLLQPCIWTVPTPHLATGRPVGTNQVLRPLSDTPGAP